MAASPASIWMPWLPGRGPSAQRRSGRDPFGTRPGGSGTIGRCLGHDSRRTGTGGLLAVGGRRQPTARDRKQSDRAPQLPGRLRQAGHRLRHRLRGAGDPWAMRGSAGGLAGRTGSAARAERAADRSAAPAGASAAAGQSGRRSAGRSGGSNANASVARRGAVAPRANVGRSLGPSAAPRIRSATDRPGRSPGTCPDCLRSRRPIPFPPACPPNCARPDGELEYRHPPASLPPTPDPTDHADHEARFQLERLSAFLDRRHDRQDRQPGLHGHRNAGRRSPRLAGRLAGRAEGIDPPLARPASADDLERQCLHDERHRRSAAALLASGLDRSRSALSGHPPRAHQAGAAVGRRAGRTANHHRAGRPVGRPTRPGRTPPRSFTTS